MSAKEIFLRNDRTVTGNVIAVARRDSDQTVLAQMGKRQVFKRKFGVISIFSFSCTVLITWEGVLMSTLKTGLLNGGTIGLLIQYVLTWIGTLSTFISIGELASMAPTAGGQYHWVAMLSPRSMRNFLSYLTGWMTCLAWVSTTTGGAYLCASIISAISVVDNAHYAQIYASWQVTLIGWATILVCIFINTVTGGILPYIEGTFLLFHILGFFGIIIPLLYFAQKATATEVFTGPYARNNGGDWSSYGLSVMVGTSGTAFAFAGADAAVHMSEEILNAAVNVPRSICASIVVNGVLGLSLLIAILFCMGDPGAALNANQQYGYPFIEIFVSATSSNAGTTAMTSILIFMSFAATVGFVATGSRMVWSFARDKGLPFSRLLTKVSVDAKIPVPAIFIVSVIPCLLLLINIGSETAFQAFMSLSLVGYYSTYFIACALLLYHRLLGTIRYPDKEDARVPAYRDEATQEYVLSWGRWHFKGIFGVLNNVFACCYLIVIGFFSLFPLATPTNPTEMNWSCVLFGFTLIFSIVYYMIKGHRQYHGPVVELAI